MKKNKKLPISQKDDNGNFNIPNFSLGLNLAMGMLVCTAVGYVIDEKRGEGHVGLLGGIIVGLIFVFYEIWKSIRSL